MTYFCIGIAQGFFQMHREPCRGVRGTPLPSQMLGQTAISSPNLIMLPAALQSWQSSCCHACPSKHSGCQTLWEFGNCCTFPPTLNHCICLNWENVIASCIHPLELASRLVTEDRPLGGCVFPGRSLQQREVPAIGQNSVILPANFARWFHTPRCVCRKFRGASNHDEAMNNFGILCTEHNNVHRNGLVMTFSFVTSKLGTSCKPTSRNYSIKMESWEHKC